MSTRYITESLIEGMNLFLLGPGGVGKTQKIKKVAISLLKFNRIIACTALTGIAAVNLVYKDPDSELCISGTTLHSWAGIGMGIVDSPDDVAVQSILKNTKVRERWQNTQILIIDEVSMLGKRLFEKLDYIAKKIRNCQLPFGGLTLLLSGDFLQLKPVKDSFVFASEKWDELDLGHIVMSQSKRYTDDVWFDRLARFRTCTHNQDDINFLFSRLEEYKKLETLNLTDKIIPTILYSKKKDVDSYNLQQLDRLKTQEFMFSAIDNFKPLNSRGNKEFYTKLLDDLIPSMCIFKVGAQVMLRANLDTKNGLVNGSRGIVTEIIEKKGVFVEWTNKTNTFVGRNVWDYKNGDGIFSRKQIPLILAWALTIHKVQGCQVDCAVIDLGNSIFEEGQAYVALSRVRSPGGLYISNFSVKSIRANREALEYIETIDKLDDEENNQDSTDDTEKRQNENTPKSLIDFGDGTFESSAVVVYDNCVSLLDMDNTELQIINESPTIIVGETIPNDTSHIT